MTDTSTARGPIDAPSMRGVGGDLVLGGSRTLKKYLTQPMDGQEIVFVDKRSVDCPPLMVMALREVSLPS